MMNYDLFSEFLLAGVTLYIAGREIKARPGIALGSLIISMAAMLGALIFAGINQATGPHAFLSQLAGSAGLPLLAVCLYWPDGDLVKRSRAAVSFFIIASAICLWIAEIVHVVAWNQIIPTLSGLVILLGALRSKKLSAILGALILLTCFTLSLLQINIYPMDSDQQLHILMSTALLLLTLRLSPTQFLPQP